MYPVDFMTNESSVPNKAHDGSIMCTWDSQTKVKDKKKLAT